MKLFLIIHKEDTNWLLRSVFKVFQTYNSDTLQWKRKESKIIYLLSVTSIKIPCLHYSKHHFHSTMVILPRIAYTHAQEEPSILQLGYFIQVSSKQFGLQQTTVHRISFSFFTKMTSKIIYHPFTSPL
jgi:hypothetical protein